MRPLLCSGDSRGQAESEGEPTFNRMAFDDSLACRSTGMTLLKCEEADLLLLILAQVQSTPKRVLANSINWQEELVL